MKSNLNEKQLVQVALLAGIICAANARAEDMLKKPAWLTDLSLGVKESYDDNVFGVSGNGLQPQGSWVSTVSPKIGFNFAPLLGDQKVWQALSLSYAPDFVVYHDASSEDYNAHKFGTAIKGSEGNLSVSLDNAFLYNDGSTTAPTYALNQLAGAAANQNDKYRNNFGQAMARERRNQIQDREAAVLQYDWGKLFIRPTASLLYYDLNTVWHNTAPAPYKGYQNWVDRSDVNGGADLGYRVTSGMALTLGYRYGSQYQQQFPAAITSDLHYSSSTYQRVLLGLEGKPLGWLDVKLSGGPDFRNYNASAPVNDFHPVKYYGEATMAATITAKQNVTFSYKQWAWVSSTGFVPTFESSYGLSYHWNATGRLGLDLGGKIQEADYTGGNDTVGSAPSVRDDRMYSVSTGISYAFSPHCSASLGYAYDIAGNVLGTLPAANEPAYRNFTHQVISLGASFKF